MKKSISDTMPKVECGRCHEKKWAALFPPSQLRERGPVCSACLKKSRAKRRQSPNLPNHQWTSHTMMQFFVPRGEIKKSPAPARSELRKAVAQ